MLFSALERARLVASRFGAVTQQLCLITASSLWFPQRETLVFLALLARLAPSKGLSRVEATD